jgi:hypothetical protein
VGHDIARLLLDYTAILRSSKELENGQIIPADAIEAFFGSYRLFGQCPRHRNERSKTNQKPRADASYCTGGLRLAKCTLNSVKEISPEAILLLIESVKPRKV